MRTANVMCISGESVTPVAAANVTVIGATEPAGKVIVFPPTIVTMPGVVACIVTALVGARDGVMVNCPVPPGATLRRVGVGVAAIFGTDTCNDA